MGDDHVSDGEKDWDCSALCYGVLNSVYVLFDVLDCGVRVPGVDAFRVACWCVAVYFSSDVWNSC